MYVRICKYLAVVGEVASLVVEGVENEVSLILGDAVPMNGVAGGDDLPCHPPCAEGLVTGEEVGKVPRLEAAATFVVRGRLSDGFHLTLVAVGTW